MVTTARAARPVTAPRAARAAHRFLRSNVLGVKVLRPCRRERAVGPRLRLRLVRLGTRGALSRVARGQVLERALRIGRCAFVAVDVLGVDACAKRGNSALPRLPRLL